MKFKIAQVSILLALAAIVPLRADERAPAALAHFTGAEFQGGAKDLFGSDMDGEQVNYVYALPTGVHAAMRVNFRLESVPPGPLFVHLKGRDDDYPAQCSIAIELNGHVLFEGRNTFSPKVFETEKFAIPEGVLKAGENTLVIACREKEGVAGMPPWFQVAACVVAGEHYVIRRDLHKDFWVTLPKEKRAMPEPLPPGQAPGFKWRGAKGWMWKPEQYLAEIPVLARYRGNFLMNCYAGMCDLERYHWGDARCNRWWEPLPAAKKSAYEQIVRRCQESGITFCYSMNPNLSSSRFVNDGAPESVDQLFQHYAWMQGLGVRWFNISLDDITSGINAPGQARVVNEILARLRARDPGVQMIFCPTFYWGDGTGKEQQPYLETLARDLDKDVYLFWTGDSIAKITRKAAETFRRISGHRLFLWDNYPVNDNNPTMHLGPLISRDADISQVVEGYMSNSMCKQNEINRVPLLTCLDYAWNPADYDPIRSLGQAILHLAESPAQQQALKELVEAYPGMVIYGNGNTGFNAVQYQFQRITATPHSRQVAAGYIEFLQGLSARLKQQFPGHYQPAEATLDEDIRTLRARLAAHYDGPSAAAAAAVP